MALSVAVGIAALLAIKIALAIDVSLNQIIMPKVLELKVPKSKRPAEGEIIQVHRKTYERDTNGNLVALYTALPYTHVFRNGKWTSNETSGIVI